VKDIDLFEINGGVRGAGAEQHQGAGIRRRVERVWRGVALGHPIGASGARVFDDADYQLKRTGGKRVWRRFVWEGGMRWDGVEV